MGTLFQALREHIIWWIVIKNSFLLLPTLEGGNSVCVAEVEAEAGPAQEQESAITKALRVVSGTSKTAWQASEQRSSRSCSVVDTFALREMGVSETKLASEI